MAEPEITYSWAGQLDRLGYLAEFFLRNVSPNYISHGEILTGRAIDGKTWAPNLREIILKDLTACVESFHGGGASRAAVVTRGGQVLGLAIVELFRNAPNPHAWIHDLVVDKEVRSHGVGSGMLEWIENEIRSQEIFWVFIETGIENEQAYHFFERGGYLTCSRVMKKIIK